MSQHSTGADEPRSAASKLFDLRVMIGGLFVVYGVILIVTGLFDGPAEIQKASGVNINAWTGIAMLVLGLLFLVWWRALPTRAGDDSDRPPA